MWHSRSFIQSAPFSFETASLTITTVDGMTGLCMEVLHMSWTTTGHIMRVDVNLIKASDGTIIKTLHKQIENRARLQLSCQ